MTTIVVYKGWMCADGRYADGTSILSDSCPKILQRDDGLTVAAAGEGAQGNCMMHSPLLGEVWHEGFGPEFPASWQEDEKMLSKVHLLLHRQGDKHVYISSDTRWCDPMPYDKLPVAIGTGAMFVRAAVLVLAAETNYPPKVIIRKAVEYAIEMDINSGGEIQLVRLT